MPASVVVVVAADADVLRAPIAQDFWSFVVVDVVFVVAPARTVEDTAAVVDLGRTRPNAVAQTSATGIPRGRWLVTGCDIEAAVADSGGSVGIGEIGTWAWRSGILRRCLPVAGDAAVAVVARPSADIGAQYSTEWRAAIGFFSRDTVAAGADGKAGEDSAAHRDNCC